MAKSNPKARSSAGSDQRLIDLCNRWHALRAAYKNAKQCQDAAFRAAGVPDHHPGFEIPARGECAKVGRTMLVSGSLHPHFDALGKVEQAEILGHEAAAEAARSYGYVCLPYTRETEDEWFDENFFNPLQDVLEKIVDTRPRTMAGLLAKVVILSADWDICQGAAPRETTEQGVRDCLDDIVQLSEKGARQ